MEGRSESGGPTSGLCRYGEVKEGQVKHPEKPRGDGEIGAEVPKDRERDGRKDTTKDGGAEAGVTTASPMTASEGPAATPGVTTASPMTASEGPAAAPAGTIEDPSRDGGEPRTGGTHPGAVRTSGRTPGPIAVETTMKPEAGMFGRGAALEEPPAAPWVRRSPRRYGAREKASP